MSTIPTPSILQQVQLNKSWLWILSVLTVVSMGCAAYFGEYILLIAPWVLLFFKLVIDSPRLLYWIFIVSIPLSAELTFSNGLSLSMPDEPIMVGILGLMICVVIYNYKVLPEWLWRSPLILIVIIQYIWTIVTVIFAHDLILASKFLLAKTWFLTSFIFFTSIFIKSKKDILNTFLLFAIPVLIHAVFAFIKHATESFGYWESNTVVQPFYRNHVDYGSILSMVFPAIFILMIRRKKWDIIKWVLLGCLLFLAIAIFVAYSRAAILAAIFSIIIFMAIKWRVANWVMPAFFVFIIVGVTFLSHDNTYLKFRPNMSKNATQETFVETVVGAFTGKDMSSMERFYRWIASVRMSQDEPIVGVGPNNWYFHYKPYAVNAFKTWVSRNEERSTTHNYFILMLTEQGWPAMILYGILIICLINTGQKTYYRFKEPEDKAYTLAVVMVIASCFVNNFFSEFLETHKVGGMFWIAVTILAFLRQKSLEMK